MVCKDGVQGGPPGGVSLVLYMSQKPLNLPAKGQLFFDPSLCLLLADD